MAVIDTNDRNFKADVLEATGLVLVDFWAEWCGPCKMLNPTIRELAEERLKTVKVVKVDVDANPEVPTKYGIRSIPTLILFKNGEQLDVKTGGGSKTSLLEWVDSYA